MSEHIEGYVEHIIFRNEENGYTVFETVCGKKELTCTGVFPSVNEGEFIEMDGEINVHPTYGEQFRVLSHKTSIPGDVRALERYLGSGAIKGIGAALASRIIRRFGEDTLRIIEEEPERLAEVKGISMNKAIAVSEQMVERSKLRDAMIYMTGFGITLNLSMKIYNLYGESVYEVLKNDPYLLAQDLSGVGFKTADRIAERSGISKSSPQRIKCGLLYVLNCALDNGSTFLPESILRSDAAELLSADGDLIDPCLDELSIAGKIIFKTHESLGRIVYAADAFYTELNTARMLNELNVRTLSDTSEVRKRIEMISRSLQIELDELQKEALLKAASNGIFLLTGGPGTGKTTTIRAMIRLFEEENMRVLLAAPTGRAAKRMEEATGNAASTIHRALELSGDPSDEDRKIRFQRNRDHPLETDVVIIDEMSMVDIFLMHALLEAVVAGTHLIFVGDTNQLPSVGPGKVLFDLCSSGLFPCVVLNRIFRQAAMSDIVVNAHRINKGESISLNNQSRDFFFLERNDVRVIQKASLTIVSNKLPHYTDSSPKDIQVIAPMRKGPLGVENLNRILQRYINPPSEDKNEKETLNGCFREGDKVMQIKNDYQLAWEERGMFGIVTASGEGVFNGDMGVIESIRSFDQVVTVIFDDTKYVEYPFSQLDELELAYAVTVHKSQGSEYPAVVIPLLDAPQVLLTRNLLYTAITRAQKCVVIVGSSRTVDFCISNKKEDERYSTLKDMLLLSADNGSAAALS